MPAATAQKRSTSARPATSTARLPYGDRDSTAADWLPEIDFRYRELPSPRNPLGVKGAGEAGTVGAAPALVNAVLDALESRGIRHVDMPLTPLKIRSLLHAGQGGPYKKAAPWTPYKMGVREPPYHHQYKSLD